MDFNYQIIVRNGQTTFFIAAKCEEFIQFSVKYLSHVSLDPSCIIIPLETSASDYGSVFFFILDLWVV